MSEQTSIQVEKSTRDDLAAAKYQLGANNYSEAISQLLEIHESLENPDELVNTES